MKNIIIGIIIGGMVFTLGVVIAATTISSKNVIYQNKTVNNALDELYNEAVTGKELVAAAITNKGVSTTSTDTYETMATNISSIDTDHTEINQKINNLESKHNSDIASLTGSINSINQDRAIGILSYPSTATPQQNVAIKRNNVVTVTCSILDLNVPYGSNIVSIPEGFRPNYPFYTIGAVFFTDGTSAVGLIVIKPDGGVIQEISTRSITTIKFGVSYVI